jgi:hypothetical protein
MMLGSIGLSGDTPRVIFIEHITEFLFQPAQTVLDFCVVCSIKISISFTGNNMNTYTVEYQTHEDTVKEMHRMSVIFSTGLVVFGFVLYIFN